VLRRIEELADEMVGFVQELIAIPTVNPPGENYQACAKCIGARLGKFG